MAETVQQGPPKVPPPLVELVGQWLSRVIETRDGVSLNLAPADVEGMRRALQRELEGQGADVVVLSRRVEELEAELARVDQAREQSVARGGRRIRAGQNAALSRKRLRAAMPKEEGEDGR